MNLADFDYELPPELIAQHPAERRDASRLLVLDRAAGRVEHHTFTDLPQFTRPGDLIVLNDTRVVRARLLGRRSTGGRVEALLVKELSPGCWEVLLKANHRLPGGDPLTFEDGALRARHVPAPPGSRPTLEFDDAEHLDQVLQTVGRAPLPPYIKRPADGTDEYRDEDVDRYQTIFAREPGAIAAPTAGLHFTDSVFAALRDRGVRIEFITLHVGLGTFKPVKVDRIEEHEMEAEHYEIRPEVAEAVRETRAAGGRVFAVGSTSCRTLETHARDGKLSGWTNLYIYPPFEFRLVDALLTNFHLPKTTLLMLIAAFASRDQILAAYAEAIAERYRFFSYGDAMLIV